MMTKPTNDATVSGLSVVRWEPYSALEMAELTDSRGAPSTYANHKTFFLCVHANDWYAKLAPSTTPAAPSTPTSRLQRESPMLELGMPEV